MFSLLYTRDTSSSTNAKARGNTYETNRGKDHVILDTTLSVSSHPNMYPALSTETEHGGALSVFLLDQSFHLRSSGFFKAIAPAVMFDKNEERFSLQGSGMLLCVLAHH